MSRSAFRHRGQSRTLLPAMAPSPPADGNGSSGEEQGSHESPRPVTEPGQQSRQPVSIGEQLTAARRRLGVSIAQASSDTRIEPGSLEALEADAPIDDFVGVRPCPRCSSRPEAARACSQGSRRVRGLRVGPGVSGSDGRDRSSVLFFCGVTPGVRTGDVAPLEGSIHSAFHPSRAIPRRGSW